MSTQSRILFLYIYRCIAVICLRAVWRCSTFLFFTQFTLNHFTLNILPHLHFCSCCCVGWTVGNCAWQSSLWRCYSARAWLQSSSIFISLLLVSTFAFFLHVDQNTHTCIHHIQNVLLFLTYPLSIYTHTQETTIDSWSYSFWSHTLLFIGSV